MLFLPTFLLLWGARAGKTQHNQPCSLANQTLEAGTYQFRSDCDSVTYCNSSQICDLKGCRKDIFPFGYTTSSDIPPMCSKGTFCPDEQDQCLPVLAVGSPCQFNRDDECEGPPDWEDLADTTGFGLNVNGSVCLNNVCLWANVTEGQSCVVQNTVFVAFAKDRQVANIVSRGNCRPGLYCDSQSLTCMQSRAQGEACDADKECSTYICLASGICGNRADAAKDVGKWVYAVVAVFIFIGVIGTLVGLYFVHRKEREAERSKRLQYYQEQNAYRQNIVQLQESARNSTMYLDNAAIPKGDEEYQSSAQQGASKSSGLRYHISDDASGSSESVIIQRVPDRSLPGMH
ncbi:hypothetical protein SCP_0313030 [Sparassis crispa]|uniref:Uncharacterized protein n=1 Tax=Sparassis crispa TaxID=139825 RepID=A0A401GH92_9APHY|nr:hypothetical protein SCP_0313030 [Sparassis crispa]GBE81574.1 hypothetical protein SCP_0313030 [Sparassis crispa]